MEYFLQENIRRCVCIIYDPSKSNQGVLALKALKLSDSFMELYRSNNFTGEKYVQYLVTISVICDNVLLINIVPIVFFFRLREKKLAWVDIFEEIPVHFFFFWFSVSLEIILIFLLLERAITYKFYLATFTTRHLFCSCWSFCDSVVTGELFKEALVTFQIKSSLTASYQKQKIQIGASKFWGLEAHFSFVPLEKLHILLLLTLEKLFPKLC